MEENAKLFYNGKIYTADPKLKNATAFAILGDRFVFVGSDEEGLSRFKSGTDLKGRRVVPGFFESHAHLVDTSVNASGGLFFLEDNGSKEDTLKAISDNVKSEPMCTLSVIKGMGIDTSTMENYSRFDLDAIESEKPLFIFSDDGHALLINTKAMELCNITKDTADPSSTSYFVRDENGVPTGLLIELQAITCCKEYLFSYFNRDNVRASLKNSIKKYSELGYVAGFDASTFKNDDENIISLLAEMDDLGELDMDLFLSFTMDADVSPCEIISRMDYFNTVYASPDVHPTSFKLFADGTVEDMAAFMYEPYFSGNNTSVGSGLSVEEMKAYAEPAAEAGYNIHIHAIGDRAIANSIEVLSSLKGVRGTRTIAHNQVYTEETKKAMIDDGGIFYNTTPYWTVADDYTLNVLGRKRFENQFPTGTMVRNNVKVTFGSDSLDGDKCVNPFWGIYYCVKRGEKGSGLIPPESEKISVSEAVDAYTINGAMQLGAERDMGSITKGKLADFSILSADIFEIDTEKIPETRVEKLYYHGRVVYGK